MKFLIIGFFFGFSFFPAYGEKAIELNTLDNYAPFTFRYPKNVPTIGKSKRTIPPGSDTSLLQGIAWDLIQESFHNMGYKIKLNVTPWARALKTFKRGKAEGLFPTTKTEERLKSFAYSRHATNSSGMVLYTMANSKVKWSGLKTLKGMKIGVIRGYSYGNEFDKIKGQFDLKYNKNDTQNFIKLGKGKIDAVLACDNTVDYLLGQNDQLRLFKKHPAFAYNYEYLAVLKNSPKALQKLADFDQGMENIQKNGVFQKILKKWKLKELKTLPKF